MGAKRLTLGAFGEKQSLADGAGQGAPVEPGPRKQTTLAQRWGKRWEHREPEHHLPGQSAGMSCTPTGDGDQDLEAGLQLGTLRPTGQPRTASTTFAAAQKWKKAQEE